MTEPTPAFQEPQMPNEGEQPEGTVEATEQEADEQAAEARESDED